MKMLLSLVVWAVLWEIAGRLKISTIVPPFSAVLEAMTEIAPTEKFGKAAIITLCSFSLGMLFALLIGIPLGIVRASAGCWACG
jgi:NitT/TauT family transport system permease protein